MLVLKSLSPPKSYWIIIILSTLDIFVTCPLMNIAFCMKVNLLTSSPYLPRLEAPLHVFKSASHFQPQGTLYIASYISALIK